MEFKRARAKVPRHRLGIGLALPFTSCVPLNKLFNLSRPNFPIELLGRLQTEHMACISNNA